ncbi:M55 family metallopeptidase [uncultured Tissierella sp.]|uniref:M55 family metallopeptidase n=1 Tax=uncultured Tissierella sp. TaxID=448160 RepID=UPI0028063C69|nr:M55 family metallopeptidase [uncultured Tissierella sp.]MDU5080434.1 M55 family metallopeptidase [Bacillota bacterium]
MDNILVIIDLEGIIGVEDLWDNKRNEVLLYKEISVIINSIPDNINIYLCYDHNDGILPGNLVEKLSPEINIIKKIRNIDFSIDYKTAFLVGFHGKKSDHCRFPHTFRDEIEILSLGEKEVGEIEMVTNLLSYYKIPVSLISTEASVIDYLDYDCIYHDIDKGDMSSIYLNLENDVKKALNSEISLSKFDDSKVEIIYNNYVQRRVKALELDIKISFKDTIDFFRYLPNLHIPLNHIISKDLENMFEELVRNKPESLELVKDENIRKLLDKDINLITYLDLYDISQYFYKIKDNKSAKFELQPKE